MAFDNSSSLTGILVSDFNAQNLAGYLTNNHDAPAVRVEVAPFAQVAQLLRDTNSSIWAEKDFGLVWTRLESVSSAFAKMLSGHRCDSTTLTQEVANYASSLQFAAGRTKSLLVPLWVVPAIHPGWGVSDLHLDSGITRAVLRANSHLLDLLDPVPNIFPLASDQWFQIVGEKAYNSRLWYSGKIPFSNELFKEAARRIKSALRGVQGKARKLVILDLDDTLWGGLVGEDGVENLVLGGHDAVGEAYLDFQRELKALTRRGVILAIVSKNEEAVALAAIRNHPEMDLRLEDFAGWKINWRDKAENIAALLRDLNLTQDAAVFIDDSSVERDRVQQALPNILVPDWPEDKRLYPQALLRLDCFDKVILSEEDRSRTRMYVDERVRAEARGRAQSFDEWLQSLGIALEVEPLQDNNRTRIAQLLNKTNQMNLSTRRVTEAELRGFGVNGHQVLLGLRARDKFGDSGLVGILGMERDGTEGRITDFVLSCRVMARRIEESMLYLGVSWGRDAGLDKMSAQYIASPKNKPCLDFFRRSGFTEESSGCFVWDCERPYPRPEFVSLNFGPSVPALSEMV